jgi:hypothetical protein
VVPVSVVSLDPCALDDAVVVQLKLDPSTKAT